MLQSRVAARLLASALFFTSANALAAERTVAPPMPMGAPTAPPSGFLDFCRRSPGDCGGNAASGSEQVRAQASALYWSGVFAAPTLSRSGSYDWSGVFPSAAKAAAPPAASVQRPTIFMTRKTWKSLARVNRQVNRAIRHGSDARFYGRSDFWTVPTAASRRGDCEDYVLAKRRALMAAGHPAGALSVALVQTPMGESHAVLLVATDAGEFVLDNRIGRILPWDRTGYSWRERQAPGSTFDWVRIGG